MEFIGTSQIWGLSSTMVPQTTTSCARSIVDGTVFLDPNDVPERRYKLLHTVGPHQGGLRISCSADGIHFKMAENPVVHWEPDSQLNMFFDTRYGKYVAYLRAIRKIMGIEANNLRMVIHCKVDDPYDWSDAKPEVVFGPDKKDLPDVDFYTNACVLYPWAADTYLLLCFRPFITTSPPGMVTTFCSISRQLPVAMALTGERVRYANRIR